LIDSVRCDYSAERKHSFLMLYVLLPEEYDRRFLRHGLVAIIRYSFLRVKGNVNWFIMQKRVNAP